MNISPPLLRQWGLFTSTQTHAQTAWRQPPASSPSRKQTLLLLVPTGRAEGAGGVCACRAAPDALVGTVSMAVLAYQREWTR